MNLLIESSSTYVHMYLLKTVSTYVRTYINPSDFFPKNNINNEKQETYRTVRYGTVPYRTGTRKF